MQKYELFFEITNNQVKKLLFPRFAYQFGKAGIFVSL